MSKKAVISVKSFTEMDKNDVVEVITPGDFYILENGFKAVYDETEISGMKGTKTTITIFEDSFILEREGTTTTKMDFKKGEMAVSLYNTPYGTMDLQIYTEYIESDIDEDGGNIVAKYSMSLSGQEPSKIKIAINIKIC